MNRNMLFILKNFLKRDRKKLTCFCINRIHICTNSYSGHNLHIQTNVSNSIRNKCVKTMYSSQKYSSSANPEITNITDVFSEANFDRVKKDISKSEIPSLRDASALKLKEKPPEAAVLVPLCYVDGKPSVLFTVRSTSLRKHRGEISFPGGYMDSTDKDIIHAALRETQEEIGIPIDAVTVLGAMAPLPMRQNLFVKPVLGFCGEIDLNKLHLSPNEVEEVFVKDIQSLCDLRNFGTTQYRTGRGYTLPVYMCGKHRIWGFTAMVLHQTLSLLAPTLYTAKVRHRP